MICIMNIFVRHGPDEKDESQLHEKYERSMRGSFMRSRRAVREPASPRHPCPTHTHTEPPHSTPPGPEKNSKRTTDLIKTKNQLNKRGTTSVYFRGNLLFSQHPPLSKRLSHREACEGRSWQQAGAVHPEVGPRMCVAMLG